MPVLSKSVSYCLIVVVLGVLLSGVACADEGRQYFVNGQPASADLAAAVNILQEGLALLRANQNSEAVDKFTAAVVLAPDLPAAHHNLAVALAKVGRLQEAIEQLQKVLTLDPNLSPALLTLGGLYQSTGQVNVAIQTYREFLRRFPKDSEAPKVANLVKGLEAVSAATAAAPGADSPRADSSDYLAEMLKNGTFRWPDMRMPIKIYVQRGENVPGFRPQFTKLLIRSFVDWSAASGGHVRVSQVDSNRDSDIECMWLDNPSSLSNPSESGEARVFTDNTGIKRGTIKLLTVPLSKELPLTDNRMRQICLHEIGHVLGLAGHTTNPADAMFFSASVADEWRELSTRDSNTVTKLYTLSSSRR